MSSLIIKEGNERLETPSGLALVGDLLRKTNLQQRVDAKWLPDIENPQIQNSDVCISYIGLACQAKSSFEDVREYSEDPEFYKCVLNIRRIPSPEIMRQRMDMIADDFNPIVYEENIRMLSNTETTYTPVAGHHLVPIDIDVSPMDNSNTNKEGVSRTYEGFDGYAPIFAYMGIERYMIFSQLRPGKMHCQKNTDIFLQQSICYAKELTEQPLLVRMDSGNDSVDNMAVCYAQETVCDFLIKRNLRKEKPEEWLEIAKENEHSTVDHPRKGKTVYTGSIYRDIDIGDTKHSVRIVYEVTERTILRSGQILLVPDIEVETWWTSLSAEKYDDQEVIKIYKEHGTMEQGHAELKTDMHIERLPSGKFDTNSLVLALATISFNILRKIGQKSVELHGVRTHHPIFRRRLKTVIQSLITIASRFVKHGGRYELHLGKSNIWIPDFEKIHAAFVW